MKGIIAQIEGKYAVVLTQNGSFRRVKAEPYMVTGVEIDMDQPSGKIRNTKLIMRVTSIAAAALLALGAGYGAYSYAMPYSYVHLDINPSIELTANVYDRIIKAEALNEDGRKLLEGSSLKYSSIEAGISDLIGIAVEKGYLAEDGLQPGDTTAGAAVSTNTPGYDTDAAETEGQRQELDNAVLVTISSNSPQKSGNLKKKIIDTASRELDTDKVESEILVGEASMEQRDEARELGVTPGKLALIEDAMEDEPELQLDDLKNDSIKELLKKIKEREKDSHKNGNTGANAGINGRSSQEQPSDKKTDNQVQPENTASLRSLGNGKAHAAEQGAQDRETKAGSVGNTGSPGNSRNRSAHNQTTNKPKDRHNNPGNKPEQTRTGLPGKVQNEGTVNNPVEEGGKKPAENKWEQAKSGIGSGNNKKIDETGRKTAGKNTKALKTERKQLSNDLLDQMEKQLEERSNKSGGKNTNLGKGNKNDGKSDMGRSGKK